MAAKHPITPGEVFGRLTIIGEAPKHSGDVHRRVFAKCECGTVRDIMFSLLVTGKTVSCGCYRRTKNITHGHSRSSEFNRTYSIYRDMLRRCLNKNYKEFHLYGGRGIVICERWIESYANFLSDMGVRPSGMSLDRIDFNGPYSPENCRWATTEQQANNKRNNAIIEYNGKSQSVAQWAKETGIKAGTIYFRRKKGWPPERCLTK